MGKTLAALPFLCIGLLLYQAGFAQPPDTTRAGVQEDLERAFDDFDPDDPQSDTEQLTQYLHDLAANPVNINLAGIDELLQVPGMNLKTARSVIDYRKNVKPFEAVGELAEVPGIGTVALERMRPYVTVGTRAELVRVLYTSYKYWTTAGRFEAYSRYQQTLQEQEGYRRTDSSGYLGSPLKYYQRFRYRSNHLSANLTQEKDAGELMGGPSGFDFNSWHVALENNGKLKTFVAGDYNLAFGQGLVLWNGGTFGKGSEVIGAAAKNGRGVRPYTSSNEANFFKGAAATYGGRFQVTGFYSAVERDATVVSGDTTRFPGEDGLHRTPGEIDKMRNVKQKTYGSRLRVELPFGFLGATGYRTAFSRYIEPGSAVYNRFDFRGRKTSAAGLDYTLLLGPSVLFGEVARSENGGYGFIAGVESPAGNGTELAASYRNYREDFQSLFGAGFGEQSGEPQNEEGIYLGLRHRLNASVQLSAYVDQYRFPAPRFGTSRPTRGYDWLALLEVAPDRDIQFYLQARGETKEDEYPVAGPFGRTVHNLGKAHRSTLRAHFQYRVNRKIRLRTRGEFVQARQAGAPVEYGYLIYQDLRFEPTSRWTIDARVTVFETDSFNSRVYQFENDLLYVFSSSALSDRGQRLYLLLNYEPFEFMEVWAKFGITIFEDRQVVGSGLNEIRGNKKSDIGVQVRIRF